jgi:hypothetical protein
MKIAAQQGAVVAVTALALLRAALLRNGATHGTQRCFGRSPREEEAQRCCTAAFTTRALLHGSVHHERRRRRRTGRTRTVVEDSSW